MEDQISIAKKNLFLNTTFLDEENSEYIFLEIIPDKKKLNKLYLIVTSKEISILKLDNLPSLIDKSNIIFTTKSESESETNTESDFLIKDFSTFAYTIFLKKIYIVNSISLISMIDIDSKHLYKIELPEKSSVKLFAKHSYCQVDTKLIFTGGIDTNKKVNNTIRSFDISTYKFENEKVKENNMIPRHSHGSISVLGVVYVIGGFTSQDEEDTCDKIQAMKIDNMMVSWLELEILGNKPDLLINPQILFHKDYFITYSDFKYCKIWYLNLCSMIGYMVDLTQIGMTKQIPNCIFSYSQDENQEKSNNFTCCLNYIVDNNLLARKISFNFL